MTDIIDVHSHIITNLGSQAPMDKLPPWSIEQSLSLMDANGIAASVLSLPDSVNHAKGSEACQLARRINEQLADIVSKHPTRFGAMATLPALSATDVVLEEIAYALDTLKLDGVATTTSIDDIYLGDTRYDAWFEEMNRRGITLFVHPVPAKASRSVDLGIDVSILEFMFDTTRMLTNMIFSGAKKRFSKIKIISTHGGGTIPYLMTRIEILEQVFGPGKGRALSPSEIREGLASFYYDLTAATSPAQLFALQQMVPLSQLVMSIIRSCRDGHFRLPFGICSVGTVSATQTFRPSLIRMRSRSIPLWRVAGNTRPPLRKLGAWWASKATKFLTENAD
jgi:predicted TIM-barrel fold metal-dependent hydrolase